MRKEVYVAPGRNGCWVVRDGRKDSLGDYRVKQHAVAFASAVAFSRHVELLVQEQDGKVVRHPRHELTYPTVLD